MLLKNLHTVEVSVTDVSQLTSLEMSGLMLVVMLTDTKLLPNDRKAQPPL